MGRQETLLSSLTQLTHTPLTNVMVLQRHQVKLHQMQQLLQETESVIGLQQIQPNLFGHITLQHLEQGIILVVLQKQQQQQQQVEVEIKVVIPEDSGLASR